MLKKKKIKNSRRRVPSSFQYEGPRVPQVTYREGREGNVFISECLPCPVCEEHAKKNLQFFTVKHSLNADQSLKILEMCVCVYWILAEVWLNLKNKTKTKS